MSSDGDTLAENGECAHQPTTWSRGVLFVFVFASFLTILIAFLVLGLRIVF